MDQVRYLRIYSGWKDCSAKTFFFSLQLIQIMALLHIPFTDS